MKSFVKFVNFQAAVIACQKLKEKMKSVREKMKDPSWQQLVKKCHMAGVDLSAHHMYHKYLQNILICYISK